MSGYRAGRPPADPRRAAALRAELDRLASALTPRWTRTGERGDVASALLVIAARLGEETTRRLDRTAERDALAFLDFLGLPPQPPRAATGVLAMALADGVLLPLFAPARTQVTVAVAGGDAVPFETARGLRVVPGRLAELVAVDPAADRIELAPAQVTALARPAAVPESYTVMSPAGTGATTLQLSPAVGLVAGDVLLIERAAHRVAVPGDTTGIVTLHDPLEEPVAGDTTVLRIASFRAFDLRNLQRHVFYVGHATLFDLDQPATITLALQPPHLVRELARLDVAYTMWGTKDGADAPDWHPLELGGTAGGTLNLVKPDAVTVDELEISGRTSRWLRAELGDPVRRRRMLSSPAAEISVAVSSPTVKAADLTGEGSRTVARASYNGTPLSTARRFFPFGPEPLRFDTFALAAPEALSKKGAAATVPIAVVDSSLTTFEIAAVGDPETVRGYGVGVNGDLQALAFRQDGGLRWHSLAAEDAEGNRVLLSSAAAVETVVKGTDLVVAVARDGRLWAGSVKRADPQAAPLVHGAWQSLPAPPPSADPPVSIPNGRPPGPVLAPAPPGSGQVTALLIGVAGGRLSALKVADTGTILGDGWQEVGTASGTPPLLTGAWQITPVQGPDWPKRPGRVELVVIEETGGVHLGAVPAIDDTAPVTVTWRAVAAADPASPKVGPAATRFPATDGSDGLWVAYATAGGSLGGLIGTGSTAPKPVPTSPVAEVTPQTALHADPGSLGFDGHPVTAAAAGSGVLLWMGDTTIATTLPLPGGRSTGRPTLLRTGPDRRSELVLGGADEQLFRAAVLLETAAYALHSVVRPESTTVPHWVEIGGTTVVELGRHNRQFGKGDLRVYAVDQPPLVPGTPLTFLKQVKSLLQLTGSVDPADRTLLRLAAGDTATKAGFHLIIRGAGYAVASLTGGVATLTRAVADSAGAAPEYLRTRPVATSAGATVQRTDVATLAELTTAHATTGALAFPTGTDPAVQTALFQRNAKDRVWALLARAWAAPPAPSGDVALLGRPVASPEWTVSPLERGYQNPELSWEYYDGEGWRRIEQGFKDGTANLSSSGEISFTVPDDLAPTEIGGKTDYWIRARLIGGDYGRPKFVVRTSGAGTPTTEQSVKVDTSDMHPPEIRAIEACFVLGRQQAPEILLVENNRDVRDQTQAAVVPEARFDLFQGAEAVSAERALHLGLTGPVGAGSLSLLVDAADQEGTDPLQVDLRTADGWRTLGVDDRTAALRRRGLITVDIDVEPVPARLFGQSRIWLKLRPARATAWAPEVRDIRLNAVDVSQARTVPNEILGSGSGEPGLSVALSSTPVLPDTVELRIRERLSDEERAALEAAHAGPGRVVVSDDARFPGSWVLWRRVDSLLGQTADARVYLLDPGSGRVTFGDGRNGRIPQAGRDGIRAFAYQQGGGAAGNVAAWSEVKLTSALEGVDTVVLPVDAAGGFGGTATAQEADGTARASLLATAPDHLRHAGRALSPADVEALAVATAPDVVRAHCAPPTGPRAPITVTVSLRDGTRRPVPTLARRDAVAAVIRAAAWGALRPDALVIEGPRYVAVAVAVRLVAPRAVLADVEQSARTVLTRLFHPVDGGPDGTGWPFGRPATRSDVLRALGAVDGLDRVESVELTPADVRLPAGGQVYAETADVTVAVTALEEDGR